VSSIDKGQIHIERFTVGPLETNCYVVSGSEGKNCIVIDPGYPDEALKEYIDRNAFSVESIINTHGHADHIMGNNMFDKPVFIHRYDRKYLSDPSLNLSFLAGIYSDMGEIGPSGFLSDLDEVRIGDICFKVLHTPGHTPGGICLYSERTGTLFSGDTLFREGVGRTDCPGGNTSELKDSIMKKLMVLPDDVWVYPGHGPVTTIRHEKKFNGLF
jgi:glyoxylase-like metal-dependent hydrolase (beta-lactamase superfamily II)